MYSCEMHLLTCTSLHCRVVHAKDIRAVVRLLQLKKERK